MLGHDRAQDGGFAAAGGTGHRDRHGAAVAGALELTAQLRALSLEFNDGHDARLSLIGHRIVVAHGDCAVEPAWHREPDVTPPSVSIIRWMYATPSARGA
ncbi:hypothetical protein GCM10022239_17570 [Leifsonia bigeumensis]|uniref:Uncharacterized protein n=1 Tax=Leifsonella bigeumensis TaxID=433643 RepID=A0ABP7FMF0_9MICO